MASPRSGSIHALALVLTSAGLAPACASSDAATPVPCPEVALLVAASDYSSSQVGGAPESGSTSLASGVELGATAQLAVSHGRAFFVAEESDRIFELDPACGTPKTWPYSVHAAAVGGRTANPHDVAVAPDGSLFVTLYNAAKLVALKGDTIARTIDLSPYDDDGNPQAESVRIVDVGGAAKAFVSLERLDADLISRRPSQMLRVDVASGAVEAAIELAGRNPFNPMQELGGAFYLAEPGNFAAVDEPFSGVERFDPQTSTSRLLVSEHDMGGSVAELALIDGCGVAVVAAPDAKNMTSLVSFDPTTGQVFGAFYGPTEGYDLEGITWLPARNGDPDLLFAGDRRAVAGGYRVHVFAREAGAPGTCTLHETDRVLDLPQQPVALRPAIKP